MLSHPGRTRQASALQTFFKHEPQTLQLRRASIQGNKAKVLYSLEQESMPGPLVHVGAVITCTHAAPVNAITSNARVLVSGMPVVTLTDTFLVAGCPFTLPTPVPKPQPCVRVQWLVAATRVLVNGQPALLQASSGLCLSVEQIPQGPPIVASTQPRVSGM